MTPTDIEKLKELATKATPGIWECGEHPAVPSGGIVRPILFGSKTRRLPEHEGGHTILHRREDAEYIAAANPPVVLSLIAALEAAQREGECHKQSADKNYALWNEERERGQAKDAEIERLKGELSEAVQTNVSALIESRNKLTEARIAARKSAIEECGVWLESQTSAFNCRDMVRALLKQDSGKAQP